jgi:hypothetical protein
MAQAVIPRPLTAEALVRSEVSPCEICGGKRALRQVSLRVLVLSPFSIISTLCASVSSTDGIVYVDYLHSERDRWTVCPAVIMWSCSLRRLAVGTFRPCTLTYQIVEGRVYVCMPRRKLETAAGESWLSSDTALTPVRLTAADKCVDVAFSSCERRI